MQRNIFWGMLFLPILAISMSCEDINDDLGDSFGDESLEDRAVSVVASYQAENRTGASGCQVASNHTGFTGSGFIDYGGNGTWIEWNNVTVSNPAKYNLSFRYAVGTSTRQSTVFVNGQNVANVGFANTDSWTNWKTDSIQVQLRQGKNTIRIMANTGSGGPNLDKMEISIDDLCPNDPNKTEPGECGCGVPEGSCDNIDQLLYEEKFDSMGGDFRCTRNTCNWTSKTIDVSGATKLLISADTRCFEVGQFESADYIRMSYSIDGGAFVTFFENRDDLKTQNVSELVSSSGRSMRIKIDAKTSFKNETYVVDNLIVKGNGGEEDIDGNTDTDTNVADDDSDSTQTAPFCPPMAWAVYYPWFRDRYPFDDQGGTVEELTENRTDLRERVRADWEDEFTDHPIGPPDMGGHGMFSYDKIALKHQVEQALDAGIDGFLPYYRGLDAKKDYKLPHFTEGAIKLLFEAVDEVNDSRGTNFRIGMHLSVQAATEQKDGKSPEARLAEWTDRFLSQFGTEKSLMRVDGKMLAVAYSTGYKGVFTPSAWRTYRSRFKNELFMVADNGSSNSYSDYLEHFDGTINRGVPDDTSSVNNARDRGLDVAGEGKLWLGEVRPNEKRTESQRDTTEFFEATFAQAAAIGARWLRIVSWNEYAEFTHIEPSGRYGDTFLRAAKSEIEAWKTKTQNEFCGR